VLHPLGDRLRHDLQHHPPRPGRNHACTDGGALVSIALLLGAMLYPRAFD
jgi:hypothetical protein